MHIDLYSCTAALYWKKINNRELSRVVTVSIYKTIPKEIRTSQMNRHGKIYTIYHYMKKTGLLKIDLLLK